MRTIVSCLLVSAAAVSLDAAADTQLINACVNPASGLIVVTLPGHRCLGKSYAVQLQTGTETPPAKPPAPAQLIVEYVTGGIYPGTSVARAFCPAGTMVVGGGGITAGMGFGLQQSYPISAVDGTIANGANAIGWQAASDDFGFAQAFVACAHLTQ